MFARAALSRAVARPAMTRSFVRTTKPKLGGGEPHPTFEPPFSKSVIGGITLAVVGLGVGIPLYSVKFQNDKHGFN